MLYVILPAFNEERAITALLEDLHKALSEMDSAYAIVVVDDGSRDATVERARKNLRPDVDICLEHGENQGMGGAMVTGIRHVGTRIEDGDVVISMDADTTHLPSDIPRLVAQIDKGFDVVIASRYHRDSSRRGIPLWRHMGSLGMRVILQCLFPIKGVTDFTTNYRVYGSRAFGRIVTADRAGYRLSEGFGFIAEVLVLLRKHPIRIKEVSLNLRYDLKPDASKMRIGRTLAEYGRIFLRETWTHFKN